jgi:hypothetical protein
MEMSLPTKQSDAQIKVALSDGPLCLISMQLTEHLP